MALSIDFATPQDVPLILDLLRELADCEREPESAQTTPARSTTPSSVGVRRRRR